VGSGLFNEAGRPAVFVHAVRCHRPGGDRGEDSGPVPQWMTWARAAPRESRSRRGTSQGTEIKGGEGRRCGAPPVAETGGW